MSLGIYIHIPYCIQRCTYCDFATYVQSEILPPKDYVQLVLKEMQQKSFFAPQNIDTLYFGGGTPSLIPAELIVSLIQGLEKLGYHRGLGPDKKHETTIEINPATIDEKKLEIYLENGVNRFSVGAQTFDNQLLKMVHREHNAEQTLQTLKLLNKYNLNYSFDILFALPTQTLDGLKKDIEIATELGAKHISPYCLTVPTGHPLSRGRPPEEEQVEMFEFISEKLQVSEFSQYEISNFAIPGYESQHNLLYWTDQNYWGLGLSAHSYKRDASPWGTRFWNASNINLYHQQIEKLPQKPSNRISDMLSVDQYEVLEEHQSLTDFCHTSLRIMQGLSRQQLEEKFSAKTLSIVWPILKTQEIRKNLRYDNGHWQLTPAGIVVSNLIFQELTFLKEDLPI